jgi:hypothetical protein
MLAGDGYERRLTLRPALDGAGHAVFSLVVDDGHLQTTNQFQVTVVPHPGGLLAETFDYPDGPLIQVGAARWESHSGQAGQAGVENGALWLCETNSEDVSAALAPAAFTSGSGYVLYARVDFRLHRLPTNAVPAYWAHYKDGGTGYRCRLFVSTNQAPPGHYRLGLSSAAALPTAELPHNLAPHERYTVVTRFNVNNGQCVLWLNPVTEQDPAIMATDSASSSTVAAWAFRQAANIGLLSVDTLLVGTAFEDVAPALPRLAIGREGRHLVLRWPDEPDLFLETAEHLASAPWQPLPALPPAQAGWRVWTNDFQGKLRFFRLRR